MVLKVFIKNEEQRKLKFFYWVMAFLMNGEKAVKAGFEQLTIRLSRCIAELPTEEKTVQVCDATMLNLYSNAWPKKLLL